MNFKCALCGNVLTTLGTYTAHVIICLNDEYPYNSESDGDDGTVYLCMGCNEEFWGVSKLIDHVKSTGHYPKVSKNEK